MNYRVKISPEAQKEIKALSGYLRSQALKILRAVSENPRLARAKELRDKPNIYRIWLAQKWRIVYQIDDDSKLILVLRVRLKADIDYQSL
jgi:mRNA-degrading endonuclease RelE of RelBE toxin-antitoxin system